MNGKTSAPDIFKEKERKACPFKVMSQRYTESTLECIEKACAWWDKNEDECAILTIARNIYCLSDKD